MHDIGLRYSAYRRAKQSVYAMWFLAGPDSEGTKLRLVIRPDGSVVSDIARHIRQPDEAYVVFQPQFSGRENPKEKSENVYAVEVLLTAPGDRTDRQRRVAIRTEHDVIAAALHAYNAVLAGDYHEYNRPRVQLAWSGA